VSAFLVTLAIAALAVSACSTPLPPPKPLPDLHLPGVTQIPGVTTLHHGPLRGIITALTTASSPAAAPRAIIDVDDELFSIGFDGSSPQSLPTACRVSHSILLRATSDGRWLYCASSTLVVVPLPGANANAAEHTLSLHTAGAADSQGLVDRLAISPDGRYLALLTVAQSHCALAFYGVAPTYDAAPLLGTLLFPPSVAVPQLGECHLAAAVWSPPGPEGDWLGLTNCETACTIMALPLRSYLSGLAIGSQTPVVWELDPLQLRNLTDVSGGFSPSWTLAPDGLRLNFLHESSIWQVSLSGGAPHVLLTLPAGIPGSLSALAGTPDAQGLVFAHTLWQFTCPECESGAVPSHLYLLMSA
jgi:hypothetical protein